MTQKIFFAPIQGYTDATFRESFNTIFGGIDQYFTPFIRVEKNNVRKQDAKDISTERNTTLSSKLLTPQILPGDENEMLQLIDFCQQNGYNKIDINFGCPFPMIAKHHKGCGILPYPDEVKKILDIINKREDISFSIKMRLGMLDNTEWENIASTLNNTRLSHITIHPRIGSQQYKGDVDMESFSKFYTTIKLPIVYNGNIEDSSQANQIVGKHPNLYGIMLGRGLLRNPFLASEILNGQSTQAEEMVKKLCIFNNSLIEKYSDIYDGGEKQVLMKMQLLWEYLMPNLEKKDKKRILKSNKLEEFKHAVEQALHNYASHKAL